MNDTSADMGQGFGNVDQIRDILFGPQLKEYSNRIQSLEVALKEYKEETDKRLINLKLETDKSLERVQQVLSTEFQSGLEELTKELRSIGVRNEEERNETLQQIDRLSKRLSSNVATLDEAIDKQTRSLRDDLLSSHKKLQGDLMELRNQFFEELEKRISPLTAVKMAKEDMAELFFELVLKLKGTDLVAPWKEPGDSQKANYFLPEESRTDG
ncbi:hypothetical protein [Allocoleopsis sp.]|uniref:hypothetical protein n=1 Tax=Allocoleopsis sp. TaxID=3088169 RepID=UPI002FD4AD52